jgi:EAL domain-containing protein (putative c-di-GMP-specific phosphodiesterase class I)
VQGVAESAVDSAIVRAVIDLANAMGIMVVAEGIENAEQVARLKTIGCQIGQGYYFSRPLRGEEFSALLARHFARAPDPGGPSDPGGPVLIGTSA